MPIWKPCIVWIAACALDALSYDTKPETILQNAELYIPFVHIAFVSIAFVTKPSAYYYKYAYLNIHILFLSLFSDIQLTEAFAHVRVLIYKNFGGYDIAEGQKGRYEVRVTEFLR